MLHDLLVLYSFRQWSIYFPVLVYRFTTVLSLLVDSKIECIRLMNYSLEKVICYLITI